MERHVSVRLVPTNALDVASACLKSHSQLCRVRRTLSLGILRNSWDANVMMGTVVPIVHRRNVPLVMMCLAERVLLKVASVLDVVNVIMAVVFVVALMVILGIGVNTRQFLAKREKAGFVLYCIIEGWRIVVC